MQARGASREARAVTRRGMELRRRTAAAAAAAIWPCVW